MLKLLQELLPAASSTILQPASKPEFKSSSSQSTKRQSGGLLRKKPLGKGQVVVAAGAILDLGQARIGRRAASGLSDALRVGRREVHAARGHSALGLRLRHAGLGGLGRQRHGAARVRRLERRLGTIQSQGRVRAGRSGQGECADSRGQNRQRRRGRDGRSAGRRQRRSALPAGMAISEQVQRAARDQLRHARDDDGQLLRHALARRQGGDPRRGRQFRRRSAGGPSRSAKRSTTARFPTGCLDCITSQAATIRHIGVVFQIANGEPYGWEGSNGCCQPTCTHVWGYEQSLSRLFPDLEKGDAADRLQVSATARRRRTQPHSLSHAAAIRRPSILSPTATRAAS